MTIKFRESGSARVSKDLVEALGANTGDYISMRWDTKREVLEIYITGATDPFGTVLGKGKRTGCYTINSSDMFKRIFPGVYLYKEAMEIKFEIEEDGSIVHFRE